MLTYMGVSRSADAAWSTGLNLQRPPSRARAPELADVVRRWWRQSGAHDCESQMKALGWSIDFRPLDAARGGHQALLLPRLAGGFHVVVDPVPTPSQQARGVDEATVARWRLTHEYAHTFFYAPRRVPQRAAAPTSDEEDFCDAFANALLGADLSSRPN